MCGAGGACKTTRFGQPAPVPPQSSVARRAHAFRAQTAPLQLKGNVGTTSKSTITAKQTKYTKYSETRDTHRQNCLNCPQKQQRNEAKTEHFGGGTLCLLCALAKPQPPNLCFNPRTQAKRIQTALGMHVCPSHPWCRGAGPRKPPASPKINKADPRHI